MRVLRVMVIGTAALTIGLAAPAAAAPVLLDDAQLGAAVLAPEDVPGGDWTVAPDGVIESEPHTQLNDIEGGWCGGATDGYVAGELHAVNGAATTTLQKIASPDEPYWFVWQTLWSFTESFGNSAVTQAKNFMKTMKTAAVECESWAVSSGELPNSVSGAIEPFAAIGNQRFAVRITTTGDGVSEETNAVYVRVANNVVVIHTRILPADSTLLKQIVKKATKKLKAAAAAASG